MFLENAAAVQPRKVTKNHSRWNTGGTPAGILAGAGGRSFSRNRRGSSNQQPRAPLQSSPPLRVCSVVTTPPPPWPE